MVLGRDAGFDKQVGDEGVDGVERWLGRLVADVSAPRGGLEPGALGVGPPEPGVLEGEGGRGGPSFSTTPPARRSGRSWWQSGRPGVLGAVGVVDLAEVFLMGNPIWMQRVGGACPAAAMHRACLPNLSASLKKNGPMIRIGREIQCLPYA